MTFRYLITFKNGKEQEVIAARIDVCNDEYVFSDNDGLVVEIVPKDVVIWIGRVPESKQ